ncbi:hypothetical protein M9H77_04202 [Catharanthus roseus]|uniref:Uncharacterized protein n=1 Tax=Catharanthus roseus TaxID=4058 RepID=A0ACC0CDK6_CATRO|nr:hypothetical protein M9H77_04202 [Catharanthus roseus]
MLRRSNVSSATDPYYPERNGLYIGQGTTMLSRAGIFRVSEGVAVDMTNRVYKLPSFNGKVSFFWSNITPTNDYLFDIEDLLEGEIFLQNLPSIVAAHALDPQQGERILDMCAAPGGKTTAIAILMKDKGEVVAVDRSHNKVHLLNLTGNVLMRNRKGSKIWKVLYQAIALQFSFALKHLGVLY